MDRNTATSKEKCPNPTQIKKHLTLNAFGKPASNSHNALTVLQKEPQWNRAIRFNTLSQQIELVSPIPQIHSEQGKFPRPWDNEDDTRLANHLIASYGIDVGFDVIARLVMLIAKEQSYNPVAAMLKSLVWDGKPRVENFFAQYLGAENSDYNKLVSQFFLLSAVARGIEPGCKADIMVILEGSQRIGKSSALRIISKGFFGDNPIEFNNPNKAFEATAGSWIMEVQELSGFNKTDSEKLKAYISTQFDKYRVPYSRRPELIPRTFVLVGSTNHSAYLNDSTGNARFYPVKCNPKEGKINLERLREDIDQILAESYQLYLEGFKWYPVNPEQEKLCSIEQEASADIDLWEPIIEDAIKDLESIKIDDVVKSILRLDINKVNRSSATRIGRILAKLGWIKERPQIDGERSYIYKRKSD